MTTVPGWQDSAAAMREDNYSRKEAEWRAPRVLAGDTILFDECGRVLDNTCYRSHYFRLIKREYGGYAVLVKHGGGQEDVNLHHGGKRFVAALSSLDSDARYYMLYMIYRTHCEGRDQGARHQSERYTQAFIDGRLRKRKLPGRDYHKVWIEPKIVKAAA